VALGCRVSQAEMDALSAAMAGPFEVVRPGAAADWVVVNACTVTADADATARRTVQRLARAHPGARIVAAGCGAALRPGMFRALPCVAAVAAPATPGGVAGVLRGLAPRAGGAASAAAEDGFGPPPPVPYARARPAVKVQDGCDGGCAYCTVPLARGPGRSLPFDEAVRRIVQAGASHRELVLAGVHLGAYGRDLRPRRTLADLVRAAVEAGVAARLRLSSVEPEAFPLQLLDDPRTRAALCPHFHLPLQSGSARVLAAMGRRYRPADARDLVLRIAARVPEACLAADLIAGFPGETDEDHRATIALVEALPLASLHVFPYSPRPGTAAAALGGRVEPRVARARAAELRAISARRWQAFLARRTGRALSVVVERVRGGEAGGTSADHVPVRWRARGERRGDLVTVRARGVDGRGCVGERLGPAARKP
jgi:threonylcarbamoyladenosine tRNA methylthiotransferase MtaB